MEADWAVEIGPEMPVIDALWPGLVDLVATPHRVSEISETRHLPALAEALLQMNQSGAGNSTLSEYSFWTIKCDLWEPDSWDPDEMDAGNEDAQAALACYIDILPRHTASSTCLLFGAWQDAAKCATALAQTMRREPLPCARADFAVRSAVTPDRQGFGITIYLTACGPNPKTASDTLDIALRALATVTTALAWPDFTENLVPLQ